MFRGREITHPEIGRELLQRVAGNLGGRGEGREAALDGGALHEHDPRAGRAEAGTEAEGATSGARPGRGSRSREATDGRRRDGGGASGQRRRAEPEGETPGAGEQTA